MIPSLALNSALMAAAFAGCQDPTYTQIGEACFKVYELERQFFEAKIKCQADDGELASVHNSIEEEGIAALIPEGETALIGLHCSTEDCWWDDRTHYNFTAFNGGDPVLSDGDTAVVNATDGKWYSTWSFHSQTAFVCRMKNITKLPYCGDYTAYNGSCVQVKRSIRTAIAAEADCVADGGHLISIHSNQEHTYYQSLLIRNNVSGTVHIGLRNINEKYQWTDGSPYDFNRWATSFPDSSIGNWAQMHVSTDIFLSYYAQWSNEGIAEPLPYICKRHPQAYTPTLAPSSCPAQQQFEDSGTIYSPGFPVSLPPRARCEFFLTGKAGTTVQVKFPVFYTDRWSSLSLYDGMDASKAFAVLWGNLSYTKTFNSTSNILKMVFETGDNTISEGQGWQAIFTTTTTNHPITSALPRSSASHEDPSTAPSIRTATLNENQSTAPVKSTAVPNPTTTSSGIIMGSNIVVFAALLYLTSFLW